MAANPSESPNSSPGSYSATLNSSSRALGVLRVTRGNIRSLGPAGALDLIPAPYRVWLAEVEKAIAALEADGVQD